MKIKDGGGCHLDFRKMSISPDWVNIICTKFGVELKHEPTCANVPNSVNVGIQDGGDRHVEFPNISNIFDIFDIV